MKLPNLAFLTRVSKSSLGKRPLIAFGGAVNNSFGVKTIFVFNFFNKSGFVAKQSSRVQLISKYCS